MFGFLELTGVPVLWVQSDIEIDYKGMLRLEFFELLFRFWDLSEM